MKIPQQIGVWQSLDDPRHDRMYLGVDSWVEITPRVLSDKQWEAVLYFRANSCASISGDSPGELKDLIGKWQRETWKFVQSRMLEYKKGVNQEVDENWPQISDFPQATPGTNDS